MSDKNTAIIALAAALAAASVGCTAIPQSSVPAPAAQAAGRAPIDAPTPTPTPVPLPAGVFTLTGEMTQGGWLRGTAPVGTTRLTLNGEPVEVAADGQFLAAFDRDAGSIATLVSERSDGSRITKPLEISPRAWRIENINAARRADGPTEAFLARRLPELASIDASREMKTGATGWRESFVWPVKARISGLFGSQRIYRGEPGSYHSGIDIAPGAGAAYVAPADGVVVLAVEDFSLEGKLLIIDHGMGLNSAFLHSQELFVKKGDHVTQGQRLGLVGSSGRATGPHLHWSLKWKDARLDPLLFTGPMGDR
ncbi:M23 family metallopeptidase [Croceicoccus ponticola]|uniref:M23 family metallopeptidase n=1 Tax=Croceicoccus ponticola TaxID=2217664 RepID=A0A437GYC4_9SPHN|nr:M23 family metallopeptidase [Croceicoccus ponticola]RVQ67649.1 M23 family metallopeptidase [Croceicoccus ponticola]